MTKSNIKNLSYEELVEYFGQIGEKPYRAAQVFEWIYQKGAQGFDTMTNLSQSLRQQLKNNFIFTDLRSVDKESASDKTRKFLFRLNDQETVETVMIPTSTRTTVCVSTQAGCKFGCRFCASGIGGWSRDLSSAEILDQILFVQKASRKVPLSHIVFMGVGEPLDNYNNLLKAIHIINSAKGINIAARRITISTCGIIPRIQQLSKEGMQIELAVSLHGSSNDTRKVLMPVNKKYPYADLIQACREYVKATKRQITFEYIMIKDVTCTEQAVQELGRSLNGLLCKMNLIPYNKVSEFDHERPTHKEMITFQRALKKHGIHATIRSPRGNDVAAACGQLRHSKGK